MQEIKIAISKKQIELAEKVAKNLQASIGNTEPWTSMRSYLEPSSRLNYISQVESAFNIDLKGKKILEVGAGMGLFTVVSNKLGLDVIGIEPCANSYTVLNEAIDELMFQNNIGKDRLLREAGENLPFADGSFDVVVAFQVLEHVADPEKTLSECIRVLKPGGKLFMDMPNYFSFVEAHFGIVWNPLLSFSKKIGNLYVRMNGKNPEFLKELNFITPWRLKRWLKNKKVNFKLQTTPNDIKPSVTTQNIQVKQELPADFTFSSGNRFTSFGRWVRRQINRPKAKQLLFKLGMADHLILIAEKQN